MLLGHVEVVLDTKAGLTEAVGMDDRSGCCRIDRDNDDPDAVLFFAKRLPGPTA